MNQNDPTTPTQIQTPSMADIPARAVTIRCRENGPLVVDIPPETAGAGVFLRVTDAAGVEYVLPTHKRAVALCRCGQTKTRPFCDGSHQASGFQG